MFFSYEDMKIPMMISSTQIPKKENKLPYKITKRDIPRAGVVLADAFQHDPLWNKIFAGESNIEKSFKAGVLEEKC